MSLFLKKALFKYYNAIIYEQLASNDSDAS